jgi:hypothetical protein
VVAHPDITVRNQTNYQKGGGALHFGEGYHLSGLVSQVSLQKVFNINQNWFYGIETKLTYAKAKVPIKDGNTLLENKALHFNIGIGYKF